jgi:RNA polymerase sigma-70 factor, ECF subfamily
VDDERVVEQAVAGSREAFDELVRRHRNQIYTLIRTLAGDAADADDLTQECFVRAYVAIVRFRQEGTFRTWITRIAVNVVRTHLARQRRGGRHAVSLDVAHGFGNGSGSGGGGEHGHAYAHAQALEVNAALMVSSDVEVTLSRRQAIVRALAMLPEECRVALTLRDVQGFEYHEIAEVLNVPIGTIESRVFRARRRLRPLLQQWRPRSMRLAG